MKQRIDALRKRGLKRQRMLAWLTVGLTTGLAIAPEALSLRVAQAQTVPSPVRQGYTLLEGGRVNDAIAAFRQALQRYPQSLEAKLGLAIAYQRAGQDGNAWQAYQQVLLQEPTNRRALEAVGLLGGYRPEWQARGIEALTTLLNLAPENRAARSQRALLYGYQGRFAEALADYEMLLSANPTPEVLLGAAQVYNYSGDHTQSLSLFERYQATGRTIPDSAVSAYALSLQKTGNLAEAIRILTSRLQGRNQLDAMTIEMRAALASAYQTNGQLEAALSTLEPLRSERSAALPLARALSAIARQAQDAELYLEAVELYRQVLAQTPDPSFGFLVEVADVLSEAPSAQAEALRIYQQLTAQSPNNQSLQVKQRVLAHQLARISGEELRQQLQMVLQSLPSSLAEQRAIAQALVRLDPPDPELLPIYQNLLQSQVGVPFLYFRVAQILMQQGNFAGARQALTSYTATTTGQQDLAPELLLAEIERREGNLEASAQRYAALIARDSSTQVRNIAQKGLAGIRLAQGRTEDALRIYDQLLSENPEDLSAQLGRVSLAYQLDRLSEAEAEAVLNRWLANEPPLEPSPELFSLVGALPPKPQRESLYYTLLEIDPDNIAINSRLVQVLAVRDPAQAQARVNQLITRNPNNINVYFVQGELAQALGDLRLAGKAYESILERQPDNTDALAALGGVRFQQQRFGEAEFFYRRILVLKPGHQPTRRVLAELSVARDHPLAALQQFQELQQEQETVDPELQNRIQELQVNILRRRGFQPHWERY